MGLRERWYCIICCFLLGGLICGPVFLITEFNSNLIFIVFYTLALLFGLVSLFLLRSRSRFQTEYVQKKAILDNIPDIAWIKDIDGRFIAVNKALLKLCGEPDEKNLLGKTDADYWPASVSNGYREADQEVMRERKLMRIEEKIYARDGEEHWLETIKAPMIDKRGNVIGTTGIARDITERKRLELERAQIQQKMFQASKLASIGELAAGVGHEINNPLAIISGHIELLRRQMEGADKHQSVILKSLDGQERAVKRIVDIVNGLRTFARSDSDIIETVDVNLCINNTLSFLQNIYEKQGLIFKIELSSTPLLIAGNQGRFQQVLVNLLSNAKDAICDGEIENGQITISTYSADGQVVVNVADNGVGIAEDNLDKIFDSFYTTKELGKGTGLGLGIVKNIISGINGQLKVTSQLNKGSCFTIYVPEKNIMRTKACSLRSRVAFEKLAGTVLVVDDEPEIRALLKRFLGEFGLDVDEASNGQEGLKKGQEKAYDFIITDLVMPVMSGREFIRKIKETGYQGGIFVITGKVSADVEELEVNGVFSKPFDVEFIYECMCLERGRID